MATVKKLENTGERMIPEFHKGTLIYAEHITRYLPAQQLAKGRVVLDIACGSGYGTQLIAKNAKKVYGVDIDSDTIAYANSNFNAPNIEYKIGDGESIPLPDGSVDMVVTFETIEHIKDYKKFIDEVMRVLKPDGLALVSTPNDLEFTDGNHFHLHEFEYSELVKLLKKDFKNIESYFQATWKYVALGPIDQLDHEAKVEIETTNLSPLKREQSLYFYLLCSNRKITEKIKPIAALGGHYSDREIEQGFQELRSLQTAHNKVVQDLTETKNNNKNLQTEIANIKNSHAYKLATKMAVAKKKVIRH